MKKFLLGSLMFLTACASNSGPSIPMKPGNDVSQARRAVQSCSAGAHKGGASAVAGGYATGIILAGILVGPAVVGLNQDNIYETGKKDAVDRCLAKYGFERRDLEDGELFWLNNAYGSERERRLNHLIGGGTIQDYPAAASRG